MSRFRLRHVAVALLLAATGPLAPHAVFAAPLSEAALAAQRQNYVEAERALAAGDRTRLRTLSAQLRDYPLYPYLRARELGQNLATAGTAGAIGSLEPGGAGGTAGSLSSALVTSSQAA